MKVLCNMTARTPCVLLLFVGAAFVSWAADVVEWRMTPENVGQLRWHTEPRGLEDFVSLTNVADELIIDASAAFNRGLVRVCFETPEISEFRDWKGEMVGYEAVVSRPSDGDFTIRVEGTSISGGKSTGWRFYRKGSKSGVGPTPAPCADLFEMPTGVSCGHLRFEVDKASMKPYRLGSMRVGRALKMGFEWQLPVHKPKLIFRASFEDSADADTAGGAKVPLVAKGLSFVPGRKGKAVRIGSGSELAYAAAGNYLQERGTIAMWICREGNVASVRARTLYALPDVPEQERIGSGAISCYLEGGSLFLPQWDETGFVRRHDFPADDAWHHVAITWNEAGGYSFYFDGRGNAYSFDGDSLCARAFELVSRRRYPNRKPVDRFFIGNRDGRQVFDGLIDEVRIWSAPLSPDELRQAYLDGGGEDLMNTDYAKLFKRLDRPNPNLTTGAVPGIPDLEIVQEIRLDRANPCKRFRQVGGVSVKELDGMKYLEAGCGRESRFAIGFDIDPKHLLWCVEIDYPDNAKRTMCCVVQDAVDPSADYAGSVGVMCGGEFAPTGKVLTHRIYYWAGRSPHAAVVLRTACSGEPAAASAIRICKVRGSQLPDAGIRDAEPVDGWGRMVGFLFEDPSVNSCFNLPDGGASVAGLEACAERVAAVMKFTGMNLFAFPGAFYRGRIGENYETRRLMPNFLGGFYTRFDREGLNAIPLINQFEIPAPKGLSVTCKTVFDGSLYATPVNIRETGRPNGKGLGGCPPNWNIAHPYVQAYFDREIDAYLDQGANHPSFKGVGLFLSRHTPVWFGHLTGGYNDYCIEGFQKATGIMVPVDRKDPLRGKAYYAFLTGDPKVKAAWVKWRTDVVTTFWIRQAKKMKARRQDLRLYLTMEMLGVAPLEGFQTPNYHENLWIGGGFDLVRLSSECDNVVISNGLVPSDYRHAYWAPGVRFGKPELDIRQWEWPGYFKPLAHAAYPAINQWERYFESAVGQSGKPNTPGAISCDWIKEIPWRVTTVNPGGFYALRHFVEPLKYQDLLGVTKGGFLIGTYGTEPYLASFAKAFRALPAVLFDDRLSPNPNVTFREKRFGGREYFYVVNTSDRPQIVRLDMPQGTKDLVTDLIVATDVGGGVTFELKPYELRSLCK